MTKLFNEDVELLARSAKYVPGRPHHQTLRRWAKRGIRGVRLETCRIGGRVFTSRQAIERFLEATAGSSESAMRHAAAERKLSAAGI